MSKYEVVITPPVNIMDVVPVHKHGDDCSSALGVVLKTWEAHGITYPKEVECLICRSIVVAKLEEFTDF